MSQEWDRLDILIKRIFERMKKLSPTPESCPEDEMLAAYHEGNLKKEDVEKLEAHLAVCDGCTENRQKRYPVYA